MKSKDEFIALVDNQFFKHLITRSLIPFERKNRSEYLGTVYDELHSSLLNYKPKPPRRYISVPKNKYVIRMVPTFELDDYCVYYFCLKVIESFIAENRTEGTFGGFHLGGKLRELENREFEPGIEDSFNPNSFNAFAWKKEYGEYMAMLNKTCRRMGSDFSVAIHFDIANFFDCIRLDLLEGKIRKRIGNSSCDDEVHLLFRFLKYWNSKYDQQKSVGIPQDEVGDCSRILSNFFLQDYDAFVFNECNKRGARFLRYADDQIIFAKSKHDLEELAYLCSHKLFEEGLNINTDKTKEFSSFEEFDNCYAFSIFDKLKFDSQDINLAFDMFVNKKETSAHFRDSAVLRRMLHKNIRLSDLQNQKRIKLLSYLWNEKFLLFADAHYMKQIYEMLKDSNEKKEYMESLDELSKKTKFEHFLINLDIFKRLIQQ